LCAHGNPTGPNGKAPGYEGRHHCPGCCTEAEGTDPDSGDESAIEGEDRQPSQQLATTPPHWQVASPEDAAEHADENSGADAQIPVADAFAQVAARVEGEHQEPEQSTLFDTSKPFNFEGAYLELEEMSVEVDRLQRIAADDAREAKESKKSWEEASKLRDRAALELRRRRLEKERREQQLTDPAHDADERLCARLGAVEIVFDVASARALSVDDRAAVESWLADAEAHPGDREWWLATEIPAALQRAANDAATPDASDDDPGDIDSSVERAETDAELPAQAPASDVVPA
jgi:hypothetical protein